MLAVLWFGENCADDSAGQAMCDIAADRARKLLQKAAEEAAQSSQS
jgi:hypothetical protein